jgi:hypothetical protein
MLDLTPMSLISQHVKVATMLYGEDYLTNPSYLNSRYKQMFEIQYHKLLTFFN